MTRIGSVPYINAMPLVEGLGRSLKSTVLLHTPARLHELVLEGKVDIALLPVVSYLENPELRLIPGTGIVCHGEVRSVKAFHQNSEIDLFKTRSIYMDP